MRRYLEFASLWLPLVVYMAVIYFLSSRSRAEWARHFPDLVLHGGEFFLLAVLVVRALNGGLLAPIPARCYMWAFVLSAHYAMLDELHQALVPGRVSSMIDFLYDTLGIDLAVAAVYLLQKAVGPRRLAGPGSSAP